MPNKTPSLERFRRIAEAAKHGHPLNPIDAEFIVSAVDRLDRGALPAEAFGLDDLMRRRVVGGRQSHTLERLEKCRSFLIEPANAHFPRLTQRSQAGHLAAQLARYAASSWSRGDDCDECPHQADTLKAKLWQVLRAHNGTPLSAERIRKLLANKETVGSWLSR